jgi:hypothetical protein
MCRFIVLPSPPSSCICFKSTASLILKSYPITSTTPTRSITTGNGVIQAPIVLIPSLNCLGQQVIDFPVLALKLPVSRYINGILGMDFLTRFQAVIDIGNGHITLP